VECEKTDGSLRFGRNLKHSEICEGYDLSGANLEYADFSGAGLSTTILKHVKLDEAILCKTLMPWGEGQLFSINPPLRRLLDIENLNLKDFSGLNFS